MHEAKEAGRAWETDRVLSLFCGFRLGAGKSLTPLNAVRGGSIPATAWKTFAEKCRGRSSYKQSTSKQMEGVIMISGVSL